MKIGIVASGGDAPGMNTVIASAVIYGETRGHEFLGFRRGWEGVLDKDYFDLSTSAVEVIQHDGGCFLRSANKGRFSAKVGKGEVKDIPPDIVAEVKQCFSDLSLDALLVIGGDGTITGANQLQNEGIPIVAIPKTIDNDIDNTDQTFGFSTAVGTITESIDKLTTTARSHDRIFFVEVMGRHSGFLALHGGIAGGASAILIPEVKFDVHKLIEFLRTRSNIYSIVVVAEGVEIADEKIRTQNLQQENSLAGISKQIMNKIEEIAPGEFDMRNTVLGHVQRGGAPDTTDRILSKIYATKAISVLEAKDFGRMVSWENGSFVSVPLSEAVDKLKKVTDGNEILLAAKKLGVYFGD